MKRMTRDTSGEGQLRRMYDRLRELGITEAELARRLYGPNTPQARVGNWKRRGHIPDKELPRVAELLRMPFEELYAGRAAIAGMVRDDGTIQYRYSDRAARYIPLLTSRKAADWRTAVAAALDDPQHPSVRVDENLAQRLGPSAFAMDAKGDDNMPEIKAGDRVIIEPDAKPRPGDIVAARLDDETVALRKYRERGRTPEGELIYELVPLNDDYPTLQFTGPPGERIIGPVFEHRRKMR